MRRLKTVGAIDISKLKLSNSSQFITTKLEIVFNVLRENIVNGNLEPGTRLILKTIANDLGVSEIPVREAIRMLEAQGLVTMTPHAGAQVSKFNVNDIREIAEIRGLLEGYAIRTAIPFIKGEVLSTLNAIIDEMRRFIEGAENIDYAALNRKFHQTIYEQSPSPRLRKMIAEVWDGSESTRAVFGFSKQRPKDSFKEHQDILAAIIEEDGDKAERLMREHRRRVAEILIKHITAIESKAVKTEV